MTSDLTMVAKAEDYLARRRALGFALGISGRQLLEFARFVDESGHHGPLTLDLITRWAALPGPRERRYPGRRIEVIRPFARHLAALDPASTLPPARLLGSPRRRPEHFIFDDDEIGLLLRTARALRPPGGLRPVAYATLFGLLACTGLRVSEALHLERGDADLVDGVLTVRATKFRKSRLVTLHPTATEALRAYATRCDRSALRLTPCPFFRSPRGEPLPYSTVRTVFRSLCCALGWNDRSPRPRIHDLRHSFACRRLQRWYAEDADVAPRVAALATYLGHAKVSDTYWYLTATPGLLALAAERFESFADRGRGAR